MKLLNETKNKNSKITRLWLELLRHLYTDYKMDTQFIKALN